jgi:hypothetical protein
MKRLLLTIILCCFTLIAKSQNASVEKSIYGIQTGVLGVWFHNELKLSKQIALRSELGLDSGVFKESFNDGVGFLMTPVITLEPRWYYNLDKRVSKSRNIAGNSGNFFSIKTSYNPDWFIISYYSNLRIVNQISIIPTWGIKRNIGNHFTYETGIGIGFRYYFSKSTGYMENEERETLNLHLRIGYRF